MGPGRLSSMFQTAASGLDAQKKRLEVAAQNIANSRASAKPGTNGAYKVQSVVSKAPNTDNFVNALESQMNPLRTTESVHFPFTQNLNGTSQQTSLGPDTTVVQSEKFRFEYDPNHPDADENGMVKYPDVDMVKEMAAMVSANRLYEANLSVIEAAKQMMKRSMEI